MKDAVLCKKPVVIFAEEIQEPIDIETMEGVMRGNKGDMLITGEREREEQERFQREQNNEINH